MLDQHKAFLLEGIKRAFEEDVQQGDYTTLSTVDKQHQSQARLVSKDHGIWAGNPVVEMVAHYFDPDLQFTLHKDDGAVIAPGDVVYELKGSTRSILTTERIMLNYVQHLSGVATKTQQLTKLISGMHTQLLDTRKTTPGLRIWEKWAVQMGGGKNHRFGLYDMVMIKDNHIDQCGSISLAVERCSEYLQEKGLDIKIEVETRNLEHVEEVMQLPQVYWVMLDNFSPEMVTEGLTLIKGKKVTEASGGINAHNIKAYAETGVDFVSSGSLTQRADALDLSLKIA